MGWIRRHVLASSFCCALEEGYESSPQTDTDSTVSSELLANNSLDFCQAGNSHKNNFTLSEKKMELGE